MVDFEIRDGVLVRYHGKDPYPQVPQGIVRIGEGAFRDCRDIYEVTLPEGLERIEAEAFQWCANLEKVIAPKSLLFIDQGAFAGTRFYR